MAENLERLLAEVADVAVHIDSEQGLFDQTCWALVTTGGFRLAAVVSVDGAGDPCIAASAGAGSSYLVAYETRQHGGEPGLLALTEARAVIADPLFDGGTGLGGANSGDRLAAANAGLGSCAAFPIGPEGAPFVALGIYAAVSEWFDADRVEVLRRLADTVSYAVEGLRRGRASQEASIRLATSEERFQALLEHSADAIAVVGEDGRVSYLSSSFSPGAAPARLGDAAGAGAEPDAGLMLTDLFARADAEAVLAALSRSCKLPGEGVQADASSPPEAGPVRHFGLILTNYLDNPAVDGVVVNIRDMTEARIAEAELRRLALHDSVSGLANRALLFDRLGQAISMLDPADAGAGVVYVGIDRFKQVNERYGHAVGDDILREVGSRLQSCAGPGDTVARLGADEFAVLVADLRDEVALTALARQIGESLAPDIAVAAGTVALTASRGISVGQRGSTPDEVVRAATVAMSRAKTAGGDRSEVYDEDLGRRMSELATVESDLRLALERDELIVAYHPIVSLHTGKVKALEALVRWRHPTRGLVSPDDFIPVAEASGLVIPLGLDVLGKAARQVVAWARDGVIADGVWISVNVSAKQLQLPDFPEVVQETVAGAGARPDQILLELTETVLGEDIGLGITNASRLREAGFGLAVDDFGTGYASLSQLKRFPVHTLKVDKGFVAGVGIDPGDTTIVTAVLSLARSFGIPTVAEGVETVEHAQELARLGCDSLQGYLFTKPLPGPEATDWLRSREVWLNPDGTLAFT